ncbi:MAG: hypothetical protein K6B43_11495 [Treponema sp.]|nr:hypothetical protein [Treponema sp.]
MREIEAEYWTNTLFAMPGSDEDEDEDTEEDEDTDENEETKAENGKI